VAGDLADPATAGRIISAALERFGRIDNLVNNASIYLAKPFTDYSTGDYAALTAVNLAGFFWMTQRAIAEMATRYGGHVVNVLATVGDIADSGTAAVPPALTNGGQAAVTRSLARTAACHGYESRPAGSQSDRLLVTWLVFVSHLRQRGVQFPARFDAELGENLAQVILDRPRGQE